MKENLSDLNEFNNIKINENETNINQNEKNENLLSSIVLEKNEHKFNKEESIELTSNIINNNQIPEIKKDNLDKKNENDEQNLKSEDSNEIKEENIIVIKSDNMSINKDYKIKNDKNKKKRNY